MRVRADNPHALPQRLYERVGKRKIVWFYKYPDGSPRVLADAPHDDQLAINAGRRRATTQALRIIESGITSPGKKPILKPKLRKRPDRVRPMEKKDLSLAPMWAWNLYRKAKADAIRRNIPWQLNPDEYAWLVQRANGKCEVSGTTFDIPAAKRRGPFGPSLDRVESKEPYRLDNLRLVCVAVNIAMNVWGLDVFMRLARAAVSHQDINLIPNFGTTFGTNI